MTLRETPGLLRKLTRGVVTLSVTFAFIGAAGAAVVFGLGTLNDRATAAEPPAVADVVPVSVRSVLIEPGYDIQRRFIGQIESRQDAVLSFELSGRLVEVLFDEGDAVEKGQEIARLDTDLLLAERERLLASRTTLSAQLVFAESQVARNEKLSDSGFASTQRLDQAVATRDEVQARISETDAALSSVEIRIRKSRLRAPFTGHVAERIVDGGETLAPGQQVLRLVDTTATTVRVGVPLATDMDQLKDAQVIVGAQTFQARLESVRPDIDPVTRTRTAILSIDTPPNLAFGRTATVVLTDRIETPGAWVPMDSVQEGRGSVWTVLVVDDDSKVRNAAVEILHAEADRMYVRGSFESGAQLIETGPQRVTPGQTVRVMTGG